MNCFLRKVAAQLSILLYLAKTMIVTRQQVMEQVTVGLHYTWLMERRVLVYKVTILNIHIMVTWSRHVIAMLERWQPQKPLLLLYDLSHPGMSLSYLILSNRDIFNVGLTELGRLRVKNALMERGNTIGRMAIVLSGSVSGEMAKRNYRSQAPLFESNIFVDEKTALEWLIDERWLMERFAPTMRLQREGITRIALGRRNDELYPDTKKLYLMANEELLEFPLNEQHAVIIGRQAFDPALFEEGTTMISRIHARFHVDQYLYVTDLNSTNGTVLNGQQIEPNKPTRVYHGDQLQFAQFDVQVLFHPPKPTET